MSLYPPPEELATTLWGALPGEFRIHGRESPWAAVNKRGRDVECFLEGPSFDRAGNLYLVDVPWGRIFKVSPDKEWTLAAEYDGWPNGLKIHRDGRIFIADYMHGIMSLDPETGRVEPFITHRYTEHFHGCNDLVFAANGDMYFTDQGQSGLHRPDGRVYRYTAAGRLECLIDNAPSPNGIVLNKDETMLYVAMTRGNSIWRLPLMSDGGVSKVGLFVQLSGGLAGPDGLALDDDDRLFVAHVGNGTVWVFTQFGEPVYRVRSCAGIETTNVAFGGTDRRKLFIVESGTGSILVSDMDVAGKGMYSHSDG
jgi:gluconolactonase